jgi:hypothetical protein
MIRGEFSLINIWPASRRLALGLLFLCATANLIGQAAPQADSDIPPDATPQIQQINPSQAGAGSHLTVVIQGSNFSAGAYVSSVSPAVHVDSSKRVSATQLEAELSVSASAQPSTVSLLVSNPASRAAAADFKIVAGGAAPAPVTPPPSQEPPKPAAPTAPVPPPPPVNPAPPQPEVKPAAPTPPTAPAVPVAPTGPVVTSVEPPGVGQGFDMDLKITGKNFVQGTKVSFANTGIRVMGVSSTSATELTVHVKVASDAALGVASMFVVNPDDTEVETPFEVTKKGAAVPLTPPSPAPTPTPSSPASPASPVAPAEQRYEAFHLGNPAEVFQVRGKVKGELVVSVGTLQYQEAGKTLINIALSDIREIKTSSIATATFHITLASGKTYHFAPGSLHPSDARNLVDELRKDLPH